MYVEYDSNNSGGGWWLNDDNWKALEAAGWIVEWTGLSPRYDAKGNRELDPETGAPVLVSEHEVDGRSSPYRPGERWLGALATKAYRPGLSLMEAVEEWERVANQCSTDAGCPCCGPPHNFTAYDDNGRYVDSGPETSYSASW